MTLSYLLLSQTPTNATKAKRGNSQRRADSPLPSTAPKEVKIPISSKARLLAGQIPHPPVFPALSITREPRQSPRCNSLSLLSRTRAEILLSGNSRAGVQKGKDGPKTVSVTAGERRAILPSRVSVKWSGAATREKTAAS